MDSEQKKYLTLVVPSSVAALMLLFVLLNFAQDKARLAGGQNQISNSSAQSGNISITDLESNSEDKVVEKRTGNMGSSDNVVPAQQPVASIETLSILTQRCIGCGRCARTDPEHFELDGRTATVISTNNLSSLNLEKAINNCPVGAITLT